MKNNEMQRENRKRDKLERELRQAHGDLDTKSAELRILQQELDSSKNITSKHEVELKQQKVGSTALLSFLSLFKKTFWLPWFLLG